MRFLSIASAAMLLTAAMVACSGDKKVASEAAEEVEELTVVDIDYAHTRQVPQTKVYTANVEADNTNNISPASPNRIKTIKVEVGDRVKKGETVVTLDRANTEQVKVRMENAEREYNRALQLLEIGAGTQQSVDQLKTELDALKSQFNNIVENTVLVSPIAGVITARNYDPGDMTGAAPILTVGQLSPVVKVMINITENDLANVKKGMPVTVTFDAFPGETFDGYIERLYPTIDTSTRTFQAQVDIKNPKERILPGMFARVQMDMGTQNHVVVPDRAIVKQTGSGNRYVYVYKDGRVSYNKVELGQRLGDAYELLSGVEDGDAVVIAGQSRLADGVAVQLKNK